MPTEEIFTVTKWIGALHRQGLFNSLQKVHSILVLMLAIILAGCQTEGASEVFVPTGPQKYSVERHLRIFQQPKDKNYSIEEVAAMGSSVFGLNVFEVAPKQPTEDVFWARLKMDTTRFGGGVSYIVIDPSVVGRIEVYYPRDNGYERLLLDQDAGVSETGVDGSDFVFRIELPRNDDLSIFFKMEPHGNPLQTGVNWVGSSNLIKNLKFSQSLQGILFGGLIIIVFYNVFLLLMTKDWTYVFYVYYLVSFIGIAGVLAGTVPKLDWFDSVQQQVILLNCATIHGGMLFFQQFMSLKKYAPGINKFFVLTKYSALFVAVLALCGFKEQAHLLGLQLVIVAEVCLVSAGICRLRQGFEPAIYSTIGVIGHALVSTLYVLKLTKIIDVDYVNIYFVEMAALWEALFFSFSLAYRLRLAENAATSSLDQVEVALVEKGRALAEKEVALAEAVAATKEKNFFLSMASHELKSPLQVLSSAVQMESRNQRDSEHKNFIRRCQLAIEQIERQLRDLFILSIGDTGKLEIRSETFELGDLIDDIATNISPMASSKGLQFKVTKNFPNSTFVSADPKRLEQLFSNVLENSIKYTQQGFVELGCTLTSTQTLQVVVADSGAGIPAERQENIFKPFVRYGAVERERNSSGIGLAVVMTLLKHLGGRIDLKSEIGVGTTVSIEIPVTSCDRPLSLNQAKEEQMRVLIVDDRPDVLEALCSMAKDLKCSFDSASSAILASNKMAATFYDVVFIDLDMPVKNGSELASEIRRGGGVNCDARLIAITAGAAEVPLSTEGEMWPFDGILQKPISVSIFAKAIEAAR